MKKIALSAVLLAAATPALAHTGHGAGGLAAGLLHPLTGPDHLLAMLAVGLWSEFVLPQRFWAGAASFLGAMALGAAAGWQGVTFPMVEQVILLSVVAFGLLVLASKPGQSGILTAASLAMIGLFASAHGHVHAAEATGSLPHYLAGFLVATGALHIAGIGLARSVAAGSAGRLVQRLIGSGIALGGLAMMAG